MCFRKAKNPERLLEHEIRLITRKSRSKMEVYNSGRCRLPNQYPVAPAPTDQWSQIGGGKVCRTKLCGGLSLGRELGSFHNKAAQRGLIGFLDRCSCMRGLNNWMTWRGDWRREEFDWQRRRYKSQVAWLSHPVILFLLWCYWRGYLLWGRWAGRWNMNKK